MSYKCEHRYTPRQYDSTACENVWPEVHTARKGEMSEQQREIRYWKERYRQEDEARRELEAQRDELLADLQEIGKRADLILAALPAPRLTVKQWHDAHGQAGMISAIAKAKEAR